jgi:hypothetical protein
VLEAVVDGHCHLLEEHQRAHADGRVRRHMETRLLELELRFDELLDEGGPAEELQDAWRAHLHRGRPAPARPAPERQLVFCGVSRDRLARRDP